MKKRITLILTVIFALALAICGSTAAFAAEENETVEWFFGEIYEDEYYGEYWEYDLLGEAKVGKNTVSPETESYEICYEFDVPESGYYLVSYCCEEFGWVGFADFIKDGTAYTGNNNIWVKDGYFTEILYYLEEGKNYVAADRYYSEEEVFFEVEFAGSEVSSLTFEENAFTDYLIESDISYCGGCDHKYIAFEDTTVKFNSGKTIEIKNCPLPYDSKNDEIVNGENDITVHFLEHSENLTMTVCTVDKFVSKTEMTNIEDYCTVVEYYDGYIVPDIIEEEITVYFTDGTKSTADFEYGYAFVEFPNGREYEVYSYYDVERSGRVELVFCAAYEEIVSYDCGIEVTDFAENFKRLHNNKVYIINDITASIRREYADYIWYSDTAMEFVQNFPILFETCCNDSLWALYDLICNDIGFFGYVTTGEVYSW